MEYVACNSIKTDIKRDNGITKKIKDLLKRKNKDKENNDLDDKKGLEGYYNNTNNTNNIDIIDKELMHKVEKGNIESFKIKEKIDKYINMHKQSDNYAKSKKQDNSENNKMHKSNINYAHK